jgi:hypothetical protein
MKPRLSWRKSGRQDGNRRRCNRAGGLRCRSRPGKSRRSVILPLWSGGRIGMLTKLPVRIFLRRADSLTARQRQDHNWSPFSCRVTEPACSPIRRNRLSICCRGRPAFVSTPAYSLATPRRSGCNSSPTNWRPGHFRLSGRAKGSWPRRPGRPANSVTLRTSVTPSRNPTTPQHRGVRAAGNVHTFVRACSLSRHGE